MEKLLTKRIGDDQLNECTKELFQSVKEGGYSSNDFSKASFLAMPKTHKESTIPKHIQALSSFIRTLLDYGFPLNRIFEIEAKLKKLERIDSNTRERLRAFLNILKITEKERELISWYLLESTEGTLIIKIINEIGNENSEFGIFELGTNRENPNHDNVGDFIIVLSQILNEFKANAELYIGYKN